MPLILFMAQLWVSTPDPSAILAGHWQSCQTNDGTYGERVYDRRLNGHLQWSFHMGPGDEFALFAPRQEPNKDTHFTPANLLTSPHALNFNGQTGGRQWNIPQLRLWVSVVAGGSSRDDCYGFYIRITKG